MRALLHPDAARVFKTEYLAQSSPRTRRKFSCLSPATRGGERRGFERSRVCRHLSARQAEAGVAIEQFERFELS
jgi:hypothetical protein